MTCLRPYTVPSLLLAVAILLRTILLRTSQNPTRRLYVLDLPPQFNVDLLSKEDLPELAPDGFGPQITSLPGFRETYDYALEVILHRRLLGSSFRTFDKSAATIVYLPFYCGLNIIVNKEASKIRALEDEFFDWLREHEAEFFTNPAKYVFTLGKVSCEFIQEPQSRENNLPTWGSSLLLRPEVDRLNLLTFEKNPGISVVCVIIKGERHCQPREHTPDGKIDNKITKAHLLGIPYTSSFHMDEVSQRPWMRPAQITLPYKYIFVGSFKRTYPNVIVLMPLREKIARQCNEYHSCTQTEYQGPQNLVQSYSSATFCLQPPGDTASRKGIFDSLAVGCIPVVFDEWQLAGQYDLYLPRPESMSVLLPPDKHETIFEYLDSIPVAQVGSIREEISKIGHRLHYAMNQPPDCTSDAVDVVLSSLLQKNSQEEDCLKTV